MPLTLMLDTPAAFSNLVVLVNFAIELFQFGRHVRYTNRWGGVTRYGT